MTFWQDARPATPRLRVPRPPRRPSHRPRGGWSSRKRWAALVVAFVLVAIGVISATGAGGETTATSTPRAQAAATSRAKRPVTIPARWARTAADQPDALLSDGRSDAILIGRHEVSSIAFVDGTRHWTTRVETERPWTALGRDTVLLSSGSQFAALDRETGTLRWQMETSEDAGPVALVGPAGTTKIAVVSTAAGGLVGLDSRTGRTRWSVRMAGRSRAAPAVDATTGMVATLWATGPLESVVRVVDGATGKLVWEHTIAEASSAPVITNGMVVIGAGNGRDDSQVHAFALSDGAVRWHRRVAAPFYPGLVPLVIGGDLVIVDQLGTVTRLRLADGTRRWATATRALSVDVAPMVVDDAILITNEDAEVITLDARTGRIRSRRRPAGLSVGMAARDGLVVIAQRLVTRDEIQAFDADRLVAPARRSR